MKQDPSKKPGQPSLAEMFSRFLARQAEAQAAGIATAETGEVVPFEAVAVQPVDARLAWDEAKSALSFFSSKKLPTRLYDFFNSINLFGQGGAPPPSWLLPHFLAFIDALDTYKAKPFQGEAPKVHVIWAEDGVCKDGSIPRPEERADDPREMKWLLNNRTGAALGPNGWDTLVGAGKVNISSMKNANHFSMMDVPSGKARELSQFIAGALA